MVLEDMRDRAVREEEDGLIADNLEMMMLGSMVESVPGRATPEHPLMTGVVEETQVARLDQVVEHLVRMLMDGGHQGGAGGGEEQEQGLAVARDGELRERTTTGASLVRVDQGGDP